MHAHLPSRVQMGAVTPSVILPADTAALRPNAPTEAVSEFPARMNDLTREELIGWYGQLLEDCMSKAHGEYRCTWLLYASLAQRRMYALINERSAGQVHAMEATRGLF